VLRHDVQVAQHLIFFQRSYLTQVATLGLETWFFDMFRPNGNETTEYQAILNYFSEKPGFICACPTKVVT
jgi:hypothetical protein